MDSPSSESMDTTTSATATIQQEGPVVEPFQQSGTLQNVTTTLKDFSLSTSELLPIISDNILQAAFRSSPKVCSIHPQDCTPKKARTWATVAPTTSTLEVEMDTESGFEILPDPKDIDINFPSLPPPTVPPPPVAAFVRAAIKESQKSRTENYAPTFSTADDPRLDFYFGVMDQTTKETTLSLLKNAWGQDPLDTLKLLANVRDIRKGKGIRPQYQQCLYWLYQNHPKTLHDNLEQLLKFGYWKDILHLLTIVMFDGYMHPYFQQDAQPFIAKHKKKPKPSKGEIKRIKWCQKLNKQPKRGLRYIHLEAMLSAKTLRIANDAEKRIYNQKIATHYNLKVPVAQIKNKEMTQYRLAYAREKLEKDVKYRTFHVKVAELYAIQLIADLKELKQKQGGDVTAKTNKIDISMAGKWTPTLEGHFDRYTLIGSTIALQIAQQTQNPVLSSGKPLPVITYLARKVYNKEYCVPLRRCIESPEHLMSENKWDKVNYRRVPAKSMSKNKKQFIKHDKERFEAYLTCKKTKVAGASLKPVEIICKVMALNQNTEEVERLVLEKQWDSLVESIQKSGGVLKDAVSICDVSGSMNGIPMQAALGLTLLTMKMTSEPWNSICITFTQDPQLFHLDDKLSLVEKLDALRTMPWGMSTDIHKVFQLIVSLGVQNGLTNDQMPKLLFVFTDMEFNQALPGTSMTNFEAAKNLFASHGYTLPTIVFWNLRDSTIPEIGKSTPVQKNEVGAVLVSGFAGQTLSYIMNAKDLTQISPLQFMLDVVNDERYKDLTVVD